MLQTAERSSALDASENPIFQRHLIAYQTAAQTIKGRVLELGLGEGYGMELLSPLCTEYVGMDKFLDPTRPVAQHVRLVRADLPPIPETDDHSFDAVVTFQVIEHIDQDLDFLRDIHRVLRPGGVLMLTTPNRLMSLSRNPWHVREYAPSEMKDILERVFGREGTEVRGIFGNDKVMDYYQKNKASVRKFTRFDVFDLQHRLPRKWLQVPYDLANRANRMMLRKSNTGLVNDIMASDYFVAPLADDCLDYYAVCTKS
jgi:SAM-dependent methyltransferase